MGTGDASERNSNRKCLERERSREMHGSRPLGTKLVHGKLEDDQFEGSFADEYSEEACNLACTQLNEALASERNARRTVAHARAIMYGHQE